MTPVALPVRLPVTFPVTLPVTLPVSAAVMVPALKLPDPSRRTIALAVFAFVAAFASTAPAATFAAVCPPTFATLGEAAVPDRSPASCTMPFDPAAASETASVRFPDSAPPPVSGAVVEIVRVCGTTAVASMASVTPPAAIPSSFVLSVFERPPAAASFRSIVPVVVIGPPVRPFPVATEVTEPEAGVAYFSPVAAAESATSARPSAPTGSRTLSVPL